MGQQSSTPSDLSDRLFRRIAEEARAAIAMVVAPDWRVVYANPAFQALAGDQVVVTGERIATIFPGAAGDIGRIEEARRTGRTVSGRGLARVLRPGAPETWWDDDIHPLPDPDGSIPAVLIMSREVTGHVLARQEADAARASLARQAEQMRLAIEAARMFFWDWDLATGAVEWSEGLEAACGMPPGSFAGTVAAFRALVHPDDLPAVERDLQRALAGEALYDTEFRMLRADGGIRWVATRGTVLRDAEGRPQRIIGIDLDITRRRAQDEQLRANEERLRLAQEVAHLGLWEFVPSTGLSVVSPGYRAQFGLDEAAAGRLDLETWLRLVHPDDRARMRTANEALLVAGAMEAEFRIQRADTGETRWLRTWAGRFEREHGPVMLGINQDVTDRRLAHDALEQVAQARGLLIQEADHRIKNSLQLVASLLRAQETRTMEPEVRRALRAAFVRVMAIGEVHRSLYQSADLRTVDLSQVLADLARHAGGLASAVTLRCELPECLPLDAERAIPLGLLVNELATNAVKHAYPAGQGGVVILRAVAEGPEIIVTVLDTGQGLPVRLDRPPGLGATLVRGLGKQIGATIDTCTAPGQGTEIRVRLPREPRRRP